ncbi:MAG: glycosyltransferase [Acetobacteraceae bacterium]|nr:glycosyltransferase [Acetobacteraceae bacterium]
MRIVLVSGSWPPDRCGVGDYSDRLAAELAPRGVDLVRFGSPRALRTQDIRRAAHDIRAQRPDIVHIQYPTAGYGRSLCPSLLPAMLDCPVLVTLHEYSIFGRYRWPWFAGYAYGSKAVIFTTEAERALFVRRMPAMRARTEVIPIGSNIPEGPDLPRDPRSVCYFGLLIPRKGIETFLALARKLAGSTPAIRFAIIGSFPASSAAYAERVLREARELGVQCLVGLTAEEVARQLKSISYAYLPFPDQVTERRGSLLAALTNGMTVLAPHGPLTPPWLKAVVADADSADAAAERLREMMNGNLNGKPTGALSDRFAWSNIAAEHVSLYDSVLHHRRRCQSPGSPCGHDHSSDTEPAAIRVRHGPPGLETIISRFRTARR